jgi:hypothetical protein
MAILLTTATNIIGVALIPLWLKAAIGTGPKVQPPSTRLRWRQPAVPVFVASWSLLLRLRCLLWKTRPGTVCPCAMAGRVTQRPRPTLLCPITPRQAGLAGSLNFDYAPTFLKLVLSCLIPTVVGKLAREFIPPVRRLVATHGKFLSILANTNLAILIWQVGGQGRPTPAAVAVCMRVAWAGAACSPGALGGRCASNCWPATWRLARARAPSPNIPAAPTPSCTQTISSAQGLIVSLPFGTMLLLIVATVLLHIVYLVFNTAVVALMRLPMPEAACVVIMASQKVCWCHRAWLRLRLALLGGCCGIGQRAGRQPKHIR